MVRALTSVPEGEKDKLAEELVEYSRGTSSAPRFVSWRHHREALRYLLRMLKKVSQRNVELMAEVEKLREHMEKAGMRPPPR